MISSTRNPKVQHLKALQSRAKRRREAGSFVVEGVRLAEEALDAGWPIKLALHSEDLNERGLAVVQRLRAAETEVEPASQEALAAASDTKTPQGILLELAARAPEVPESIQLALILDEMRDPGNLGTLLRGAAAAGADLALIGPGSADPWAPKVLRAAMGAHFHLPVVEMDWAPIGELCRQRELRVYLAAAGEGRAYDEADLTEPLAFIVGGEAEGAGQAARALATDAIHIPMPGRGESLNAAMAGTLLLFEALRQRRARGVSA